MPKSVSAASYHSMAQSRDDDGYEGPVAGEEDQYDENRPPRSPTTSRRLRAGRPSDLDLQSRFPGRLQADENTSLLGNRDDAYTSYRSMPASGPGTPRPFGTRHNSSLRLGRNPSRKGSFSMRLVDALGTQRRQAIGRSRSSSSGAMYSPCPQVLQFAWDPAYSNTLFRAEHARF